MNFFVLFSGIRQLQLILLKVCLILGVEVHTGVEYKGLIEPSVEKGTSFSSFTYVTVMCLQKIKESDVVEVNTAHIWCFCIGWMAKLQPPSHPAEAFQFDVFISAGGGRFVPEGTEKKKKSSLYFTLF